MAITAAIRTNIIELNVLAGNGAPGTTGLGSLVTTYDKSGIAGVAASLTAAASWTTKFPSFQTPGEFAKEFLEMIVPGLSEAGMAEGVTIISGLLNSGSSQADVLTASSNFLAAASVTDAAFGDYAAKFQNQAAVAEFHTVTQEKDTPLSLADVTSDAATVVSAKGDIDGSTVANAAAAATAAAAAAATLAADNAAAAATTASTEAAAATVTAIAAAATAEATVVTAKAASDAAATKAALTDATALTAVTTAASTDDVAAQATLTTASTAYDTAIAGGDAAAVSLANGTKLIAAAAAATTAAALATAKTASDAATADDTAATAAATALTAASTASATASNAADAAAAAQATAAAATADTADDAVAATQVTAAAASNPTGDAIAATASAAAAVTAATAASTAAATAATAAEAASSAANSAATTAISGINDNITSAAALVLATAASTAAAAATTATAAYTTAAAATADVADDAAAATLAASAAVNATAAAASLVTATTEAGITRQTLSLTTGVDALAGGAGSDIFNGVVQGAGVTGSTASPGDVINGGGGIDTFNLSIAGSGGGPFTVQAIQAAAVENLLVTNFDSDAGETTIDTALMSGMTNIGLSASSAAGDTTFSGLKSIVDAQMRNGNANLTLTYAAGTTGTADTQNLAVSAVTAGSFTANGLETVAVTGSLTANKLTNIAGSTLKAITIGGDQNFTMTGASTIKTIDASANTGKTSLVLGAQAAHVVTAGAGNDTIDAGVNLSYADKVQGGAGTDTIKISAAGTINGPASATDISAEFLQSGGFEVIDIASTNDLATLALAKITGVETAKVGSNVALFGVSGSTETDADVVNFTLNGTSHVTGGRLAATATIDTFEELVAIKINTLTGFSAVAGTNTVTITNTGTSSEVVEFGLTSVTGTGTVAAGGLTTGYTNVAVTGITTQAVDIYSADSVTARMLDPSGASDVMNVNLKSMLADRSLAQTVATLNVADTIETLNLNATGMKTGTAAVTKTLSALTADSSMTTLNITGSDKLTITAMTTSKLATIDASTHTGDLSLPGTASLAQTITTGSGNDTIIMAGNLTAADVIDGGGNTALATGTMGKDTLTASAAIGSTVTASALQISNVETVNLSGSTASFIDGTNLTNVGKIAISSVSGSHTFTNMPAGAGLGIGIDDVEGTGTYTWGLADATGTADALTASYSNTINANTTTALVTSGIETLNIVTTTATQTPIMDLSLMKAATINVTKGATTAGLDLGTLNKATSSVQAGTNKSALTFTGGAVAMDVGLSGAVVNTVTLSTKADTVTLTGLLGTNTQVLNGGAVGSATAINTLNVLGVNNAASDFTSVSNFTVVNLTVPAAAAGGVTGVGEQAGLDNASFVNILGGNSNSTFTVLAAAAFTRTKASASPQTVDASAFGGAVNLQYALDDLDAYTTVKGGTSASDRISTFISDGAGATLNKPTMSGIERLTISATNTDVDAVMNLANVTGLTRVDATFVNAANADQIELDSLAAGVPVYVTQLTTLDNLDVGVTGASTGSADSLNIVNMNAVGTLNLDAAGIEVLGITSALATVDASYDLAGVTATLGSSTAVSLTGAGDVTFTAINTGVASINGAAMGGTLTVTAAARDSDAITITGGVNNDIITMENAADVLTGGAGVAGVGDTLIINYSAILGGLGVDLSQAGDQVTSVDGTVNAAVQSGFENIDVRAYAGFGTVIVGSDGVNTITGSAGNDRVSAGKGNDIINQALTNEANTDQINGGSGADTFTLLAGAYVPAADSSLVSVETVTSAIAASTITLTSQTEAFTITGGAGVQTLTGGSGVDTITGGGGADIITGGIGADIIDVTAGADVDIVKIATAAGATGGDSATFAVPAANTVSTAGMDIITGMAATDKIQFTTGYVGAAAAAAGLIVAIATPVTVNGITLVDNGVVLAKGNYTASTSTFVGSNTGTDTLAVYDADATLTTTAYEAVVLIGYVDAGAVGGAAGLVTLV